MALIVHLSDLHMTANSAAQDLLFDRLVDTLRREYELLTPKRTAIVVTGDIFDSADGPGLLVHKFLRLQDRLIEALGNDAFTIVIPGNHDRRKFGFFGPHRDTLFRRLYEAADPKRLYVAGCRTPFLAEIVPPALHGLHAHVVAYDSSFLPRGYVGAGGTFRQEDLLQIHALLPDDDRPLLLLVHHHLIPTPVTDISPVDLIGTPRLTRWFVGRALPALVSNADREELTMTALGAGTALSTLHSFGRAVLLLHGHKHVPTARMLTGTGQDDGDLLLVSAGSAGREELLHGPSVDSARLWPSFNLIHLTKDKLRAEALSFSAKHEKRRPVRRELARARRDASKWAHVPVNLRVSDARVRVEADEASFTVSPSRTSLDRWDFEGQRTVRLTSGARLRRYTDFVHALPEHQHGLPDRRIVLKLDGVTRYSVSDGLCRTVREGARWYGPGTAFEWVGLLCRHGASTAKLTLACTVPHSIRPFGSVTDLTTGRESPAPVERHDDHWTVTSTACAPRSLLRIYWPLAEL